MALGIIRGNAYRVRSKTQGSLFLGFLPSLWGYKEGRDRPAGFGRVWAAEGLLGMGKKRKSTSSF